MGTVRQAVPALTFACFRGKIKNNSLLAELVPPDDADGKPQCYCQWRCVGICPPARAPPETNIPAAPSQIDPLGNHRKSDDGRCIGAVIRSVTPGPGGCWLL